MVRGGEGGRATSRLELWHAHTYHEHCERTLSRLSPSCWCANTPAMPHTRFLRFGRTYRRATQSHPGRHIPVTLSSPWQPGNGLARGPPRSHVVQRNPLLPVRTPVMACARHMCTERK